MLGDHVMMKIIYQIFNNDNIENKLMEYPQINLKPITHLNCLQIYSLYL